MNKLNILNLVMILGFIMMVGSVVFVSYTHFADEDYFENKLKQEGITVYRSLVGSPTKVRVYDWDEFVEIAKKSNVVHLYGFPYTYPDTSNVIFYYYYNSWNPLIVAVVGLAMILIPLWGIVM